MGAQHPDATRDATSSEPKGPPEQKKRPKVLVLGGGLAGLTTAWALTRGEDDQAPPFEVHVYQMGWRMGGKGRTGRQVGNRHRLIEHGLHAFGGYYHNTFSLLREVMGDDGVRNHFKPTSRVAFPVEISPRTLSTKSRLGVVAHDWPLWTGKAGQLPGDKSAAPSVGVLIGRMAQYLEKLDLVDLPGKPTPAAGASFRFEPLDPPPPANLRRTMDGDRGGGAPSAMPDDLEQNDESGWSTASMRELRGVLTRTSALGVGYLGSEATTERPDDERDQAMIYLSRRGLAVLEARPDRDAPEQAGIFRTGLDSPTHAERQALLRNVTRLCLATLVGVVSSSAITKGLQVLDCMDFRDFLRTNGASERTACSGVVKGIYDYVFAYEDGDPNKPSLAAGVAVRFMLLFFLDSVGGLQWHMKHGMGESVILPICEKLKRRGVHFHTYQEVRRLVSSPDGGRIVAIELYEQRSRVLRNGAGDSYEVGEDPKGAPIWLDGPNTTNPMKSPGEDPVWSLEAPAPAGAKTRTESDFDYVVLAIPPAAHEAILPESLRKEWEVLFEAKHNISTISAQVWGAVPPRVPSFFLVGREGLLFHSVADMSHQLKYESGTEAKHLYFLVSPCLRPSTPMDARASDRLASRAAKTFFQGMPEDLKLLGMEWKHPGTTSRTHPLGEDHVQRNDRPSDLYVRSAPHTISKRPKAEAPGVENLVLAGDWVQTGLNFGCAEAAVISGLRAANVLLARIDEDPVEVYEAGGPS